MESVVIIAFRTVYLICLYDLYSEAVTVYLDITLAWIDKLRRDFYLL